MNPTPSIHRHIDGAAAGVPIVMSHALGMDLHMWDGLAAVLAPQHPLLRYDHRGQGRSAALSEGYALQALVDDAAALIHGWGRGPVVFIGLSMGGLVGQGLAIQHPNLLRALVLANTAAVYPPAAREGLLQRAAVVRQQGMPAVIEPTIERFISAAGRERDCGLAAFVRASLERADPAGYAFACQAIATADWLPQLGAVRCPTLVISAEQDPGSTPAMGQQIADAITDPRAAVQHLRIDGAAHLSVLEQPLAFADAVRGLLAHVG